MIIEEGEPIRGFSFFEELAKTYGSFERNFFD